MPSCRLHPDSPALNTHDNYLEFRFQGLLASGKSSNLLVAAHLLESSRAAEQLDVPEHSKQEPSWTAFCPQRPFKNTNEST